MNNEHCTFFVMMMTIVGHYGMVWLGTLAHGNREIEVAIKKIRGIVDFITAYLRNMYFTLLPFVIIICS